MTKLKTVESTIVDDMIFLSLKCPGCDSPYHTNNHDLELTEWKIFCTLCGEVFKVKKLKGGDNGNNQVKQKKRH